MNSSSIVGAGVLDSVVWNNKIYIVSFSIMLFVSKDWKLLDSLISSHYSSHI